MALVPCRECEKIISSEAEICPNCGIKRPALTSADNEKQPVLTTTGDDVQTVKKTLLVIATIAAVIFVIIFIANMPDKNERELSNHIDNILREKREKRLEKGY